MYRLFATVLLLIEFEISQQKSSKCTGRKCRNKVEEFAERPVPEWIANCSYESKRNPQDQTKTVGKKDYTTEFRTSKCRVLKGKTSKDGGTLIECQRRKKKARLLKCKAVGRVDKYYYKRLIDTNLVNKTNFLKYNRRSYYTETNFTDKMKSCWQCDLRIPLNNTRSIGELLRETEGCSKEQMKDIYSYCSARVVQNPDWSFYKLYSKLQNIKTDGYSNSPIETRLNNLYRFNRTKEDPSTQYYYCNAHNCNERLILEKLDDPSSLPIILSHDPVEVARLGVRVLMLVTMGTMSVTSMLVLSYFVCRTRRRRKAASYKQVDGDIEVGESETNNSPGDDKADFQDEILIKNGRFCKVTLVKRGGKMMVKKQHVQSRNFENEKTVFELFKGHHPSIVFCYEILTSKKTLLMGYYERGNLRDYLSNVSLSCSQLINLVQDVFTAVSYIHGFDILQNSPSNISLAHRDIKTANFLVQDDGRCVLSDFDLSINLDTLEEDCSLRQVGTMLYMSPELLDCTMLLSAAGLVDCDLYSLGAVLWEISNLYCQVAVGAPAAGYVHVYQPQLPAMYTYTNIVNLVVIDQFRPDLKKLELDTVESEDQTMIERLDECISDMMDTDCESRISAHCAFNRIFGITRQTPTQLSDT